MLLKNLFTFSFLFSFIAFILNKYLHRADSLTFYLCLPHSPVGGHGSEASHCLKSQLASPGPEAGYSLTAAILEHQGPEGSAANKADANLHPPRASIPSWGITLFFFNQCNFASLPLPGCPLLSNNPNVTPHPRAQLSQEVLLRSSTHVTIPSACKPLDYCVLRSTMTSFVTVLPWHR